MNEKISITDVVYRYDQALIDSASVALKKINLTIHAGEFISILGHNGSGKSTLAKHINALLLPTEGTIVINGWDTLDKEFIWDIRQTVGMVFQNPDNQMVATTVEDDVAFGLENMGIPPNEMRKRIDEALDTIGMNHLKEVAPHHLSGGQKQRVAIAGIIAMRPKVIVFDEATAMLDPSGRAEVLRTAHMLHTQEGMTIIHITHYLDEVIDSDRVIVMADGNVLLQGKPSDVFKNVDLLKRHALDVPFLVELNDRLQRHGINIEMDPLDEERWVEELWTLL